MSQHSVFISYRRSDSTGEAGRLSDSLEALLGTACVFRDADGIAPGDDFEAALELELAATSAVLVLIADILFDLRLRHRERVIRDARDSRLDGCMDKRAHEIRLAFEYLIRTAA